MDSSGNNMGSLFDLLTGGGWGFANGGTMQARSIMRVNERGFEMASVGGKDYMLTSPSPVHITPNHKLGGGSVANHYNFALSAPTELRTQQQIASRIHYQTNPQLGEMASRGGAYRATPVSRASSRQG